MLLKKYKVVWKMFVVEAISLKCVKKFLWWSLEASPQHRWGESRDRGIEIQQNAFCAELISDNWNWFYLQHRSLHSLLASLSVPENAQQLLISICTIFFFNRNSTLFCFWITPFVNLSLTFSDRQGRQAQNLNCKSFSELQLLLSRPYFIKL